MMNAILERGTAVRAPVLDVLRAVRYEMDIPAFAREQLRLPLEPAQERLLADPGKRVILNCTRQWGKSTVAGVAAIHRGVFRPGALILIVSPTQRQSSELLLKIRELVVRLDVVPRGDGQNAASLLLPNGSRILALPGVERNVRGFSAASLVLVDEASQAPNELYRVMRPMLGSSKGDIWLMSTPFGKRGFFFEAWSDEKQAWTRVMSPATECPRFTAEFLEEERYVQGDAYFRQEYMCEFIDDDDSVFTYEELMKVVFKGNSAYKL